MKTVSENTKQGIIDEKHNLEGLQKTINSLFANFLSTLPDMFTSYNPKNKKYTRKYPSAKDV